jgi:hypothetical protein
MNLPEGLSKKSEILLFRLLFKLSLAQDNGMHKYYEWNNEKMKLVFLYDRGYYDCEIEPFLKPIERMGIIRLLRFLKKDKDFYKKELISADLSFTLSINEYVELFYNNYNLIGDFLNSFNQEKYDAYNKYEFSFDK